MNVILGGGRTTDLTPEEISGSTAGGLALDVAERCAIAGAVFSFKVDGVVCDPAEVLEVDDDATLELVEYVPTVVPAGPVGDGFAAEHDRGDELEDELDDDDDPT